MAAYEVNARQVQALRQETKAPLMDCKEALVHSEGDHSKAIEYLRKKGLSTSARLDSRSACEGLVHSYIHGGGKIGVLVEVNCETDFVARNEDFQRFVKDIAMHIAASGPHCVSRDDVPQEVLLKEKNFLSEQAQQEGKQEAMVEKIVEGRLNKFFKEICLMEQPFIRDPDQTIFQLLHEYMAKLGEKIVIRRFVRFQLGEGLQKRTGDFASEVAQAASS